MRIFIIIVSLLLSDRMLSQEKSGLISTWNYFKTNGIVLNSLEPPAGYVISYNCDSMLFVRGDFSDTIKIWTPGGEWAYTLGQFGELTVRPEYGKTVFAKSIFPDGRILVASYMETVFIFRNDSLYEIEDTVSKPSEYFALTVDHVLGKVNETTFKQKKDSIELLYKDRHAYLPKLIFARDMFHDGKKKVRLSRKVNYEQDEIVLEREWVENNKRCYVIRINNRFGKEKTSYAYAIDEDIKFIWWEGCGNRSSN